MIVTNSHINTTLPTRNSGITLANTECTLLNMLHRSADDRLESAFCKKRFVLRRHRGAVRLFRPAFVGLEDAPIRVHFSIGVANGLEIACESQQTVLDLPLVFSLLEPVFRMLTSS